MKNENIKPADNPIDLVYLWVNGKDPEWQKRRTIYSNTKYSDKGRDCDGRYADHDELKFSLRSTELYAPWINKIYIITDNQIPVWLDISNPKIKIVDHKEILPQKAIPSFNSSVIEHFFHKIPGLSERFLYANDDMFFNREVKPSDFFRSDGLPVIRLNRRMFKWLSLFWKEKILKKKMSNYNKVVRNAANLVKHRYGKFYLHKAHHNIDAYLKSDFKDTFQTFQKEIEGTLDNHIRNDNDIQRSLYSYAAMAKHKAHVKFVNHKTSFHFHIEKMHYYKKLAKCSPMFFCMNDSEYADENARITMAEFLNQRFPQKSAFEK